MGEEAIKEIVQEELKIERGRVDFLKWIIITMLGVFISINAFNTVQINGVKQKLIDMDRNSIMNESQHQNMYNQLSNQESEIKTLNTDKADKDWVEENFIKKQ